MIEFIQSHLTISLIILGLWFGFFASVFGNSLPLNLAVMQIILPGASFGALVGTAKFGGMIRGSGFLLSVYQKIDLKLIAWILPPIIVGTLIGVNLIAHLDSKWIFPTLVIAYFVSEFSSFLSHKINHKTLYPSALAAGVYIGFLGAGMRSILMGFLRLKHPEDEKISLLKIHCSLTSSSTALIATAAHYFHGNLVWAYCLPFAGGCFFGGLAGGKVMNQFTIKSAGAQKWLLRVSFGIGILVSGYLFFQN